MTETFRPSLAHCLGAVLLAITALPAPPAAAAEALTLRINDTTTLSGGIAAVTLRTYASRPIGQGQVCLQFAQRGAVRGGTQGPIATVEGATVFSASGDAIESVIFDGNNPAQPTMVSFSSASASINAADGPLAVVFLRMNPNLPAGAEYDILLDLPNTQLMDAGGEPIAVEARNGVISIRDPAVPPEVSGNAEDTVAGEIAVIGMQTNEQFAIHAGQVGLRYDPALSPAWIKVTMDPRYGASTFDATTAPGLIMVSFSSPDGSLNSVPGELISVRMPTNALLTRPIIAPVVVDPSLTFLWDGAGQIIPMTVESDTLVITPGPVYAPAKPRPPALPLRRR